MAVYGKYRQRNIFLSTSDCTCQVEAYPNLMSDDPSASRLSFSEDDCTNSLDWPPCVHMTLERDVSEVLCTKCRERSGVLRSHIHGATRKEPSQIPAINPQVAMMRSARRPNVCEAAARFKIGKAALYVAL